MLKKLGLKHRHFAAVFLAAYDAVAVNISFFLALWIRFDCRFSGISTAYLRAWMRFIPIYTVFCLIVFILSKLYNSLWKYAGFAEMLRAAGASTLTAVFHAAAITVLFCRMPLTYYAMGTLIQCVLILGIRFSYRFVLMLEHSDKDGKKRKAYGDRVMIIGAGSAGQMLLKDIRKTDEITDNVVCMIDDDVRKQGGYIDGVPVAGGREDIISCVKKYRIAKIYVAIPSASAFVRRDILEICKESGCEVKNVPGLYQLIEGKLTASDLKDVDAEDLLGRDPIKVDNEEIFEYLKNKVILVTGGGGSIGSELCRQIAGRDPGKLIIFDICENYVHNIMTELKDKYPKLDLVVEIGSVRDSRKLDKVFEKYRPQVVYHAAAHKHVPLMEYSPCEAIKNNAIGTYKTAYAALINGCERFVLISTDKAVNPVNIMGASKRLCEMVIQLFARKVQEGRTKELHSICTHTNGNNGDRDSIRAPEGGEKTCFVAVRFGNVLGSNGSVIPRFREQIAKGGPVTVTHPDIIRYFMTIPEAVSLVLQAGLYAEGGEIFVLDMGSPVKIDTLARNLIRLSGFKPDVDIKIEYTGLRPGEKLYEEKLMAEEGLRKTKNELIHIANPLSFDADEFIKQLIMLMNAAYDEREDIRTITAQVVKTYRPVQN